MEGSAGTIAGKRVDKRKVQNVQTFLVGNIDPGLASDNDKAAGVTVAAVSVAGLAVCTRSAVAEPEVLPERDLLTAVAFQDTAAVAFGPRPSSFSSSFWQMPKWLSGK